MLVYLQNTPSNLKISSLNPKISLKIRRPKVHFFSNFYYKIKQILEGYVGCLQFYDIRHLNSSHTIETQLVERKKNLQ
jgi:hypothetical protein